MRRSRRRIERKKGVGRGSIRGGFILVFVERYVSGFVRARGKEARRMDGWIDVWMREVWFFDVFFSFC